MVKGKDMRQKAKGPGDSRLMMVDGRWRQIHPPGEVS